MNSNLAFIAVIKKLVYTKFKVVIIIGVLILVTACQENIRTENYEKEQVIEVLERLIEADRNSDLDAVLLHYDEKAVLMPPNNTVFQGKAKIREHYDVLFTTSSFQELQAPVDEVYMLQDIALIIGRTEGTIISLKDSTSRSINSKFIMTLKKDTSSSWRVQRLIWDDNQ